MLTPKAPPTEPTEAHPTQRVPSLSQLPHAQRGTSCGPGFSSGPCLSSSPPAPRLSTPSYNPTLDHCPCSQLRLGGISRCPSTSTCSRALPVKGTSSAPRGHLILPGHLPAHPRREVKPKQSHMACLPLEGAPSEALCLSRVLGSGALERALGMPCQRSYEDRDVLTE